MSTTRCNSDDPKARRLLGVEGNFGESLGLTKDWAYRFIKPVGNYGEVFDRNLGEDLEARDQTRHQCALDAWRHSICAADALITRSNMLGRYGGGFAPTRNALIQIAFVLGLAFVVYEGAATAVMHLRAHHIRMISASGTSALGSTSISG